MTEAESPISDIKWLFSPRGRMLRVGLKISTNFYRNVGGTIAGFPFHIDIPANGVVTMILNIHREALFQITRGEVIADIQLAVGSSLILSGESRYEWKHRVLPMAAPGPPSSRAVERVSLVLGYQ